MKRALLTAAIIAKNEEKFLGGCLDSLKGVADEVVVVDTGSTDRTREIASAFGARVYEHPWEGDFSAARNRALDYATGEWILYIDADERVRPESVSDLRAELSSPSLAGYRVLLHPRKQHTPYWSLRLWRNDPSIRFEGVIHESAWRALVDYCHKNGLRVGESRMNVDHEGYESNHTVKNDRNLPLLLKALEQDPERIYSWCHLANIYNSMNQPERADEAWTKALAVIRKRGPQSPEDILPYLGLVENGVNRGDDRTELFAEAVALFPSNPLLLWTEGSVLMRQGKFHQAIPYFETLLAHGRSGNFDNRASYDLRMFGVRAYDAIATCHLRLSNYAEARCFYAMAAREEPDSLEYRVKLKLCSTLESRAEALAS